MSNGSLSNQFNNIPWLYRVVLQLVFGILISGIYRLIRFSETKNVTTLLAGVIGLFTGIGNIIFWWVDLITLVMNGRYTMFVD